jgi:membrane-bound lytic murein transglycosylase D
MRTTLLFIFIWYLFVSCSVWALDIQPSPEAKGDASKTAIFDPMTEPVKHTELNKSHRPQSAGETLWEYIGRNLTISTDYKQTKVVPLEHYKGLLKNITLASERAALYLPYIISEIEKRNLPIELALIPIIESGYRPDATSPSGATGLWQLMAATANRLQLHQSKWYDGRRDIKASTQAALTYFEQLRDRFHGDWKLIFAAYHSGERTIERAIERNLAEGLGVDFYSLKLPTLTEAYVPKLLALIEIVSSPDLYGVKLNASQKEAPFAGIDVGSGIDLNRVIGWAGMTSSDFDQLNPGFLKRLTIEGASTEILVFPEAEQRVRISLAQIDESMRYQPRIRRVAPRETLSEISAQTGVSVKKIKQFNSLRTNHLRIGQRLLIPMPNVPKLLSTDTLPRYLKASEHIVKANDTLWDLAKYYKTTVQAIERTNDLTDTNSLRIGQKLILPDRAKISSKPTVYVVKQGDTLWLISRRFGIPIRDLASKNKMSVQKSITIGQRLRLR